MKTTTLRQLATAGLSVMGLLALLLTSPLLLAVDPPRQFDIELLVFENLVPGDNGEIWPVDYSEWFEEFADEESPRSTDAEQRQWLSGQQLQMTAKYNAMRRSSGYRPLTHIAWRQAVLDRQTAKAFDIPTETTRGSYVDGTARIAVERYLHLYLDLQFHTASQLTGDLEDSLEFDLPEIRLSEHRRMRSKEVHYFDNPRFGVIALITPYVPPEPVEEALPDVPGQTENSTGMQ